MPSTNDQNFQASSAGWAAQVDESSKSDHRTKPWEAVVETAKAEGPDGDVINVDANPLAACDISVSA
ncbi:hypothetical protein QQZ08_005087 [Neonectria magnoliae]|uniref:Uncharacterized protein n=1 Tax=Neonectria magnoliae TaxID=2732573 RepID=A0ABR1I4K2_9HYPO